LKTKIKTLFSWPKTITVTTTSEGRDSERTEWTQLRQPRWGERQNKREGRNEEESQLREKKTNAKKKGMDSYLYGGDNKEKKPSVEKKIIELCERAKEESDLT